ncbi:MAG: hypothetical protein CMP59_10045 [Flavobacteriales bacterium]|nr:hypothetical protein [Flavobacteriales bacterium]
MKINKPAVLFLPKWYPYKGDPFDGNFVENHAHSIKQICDLKVLFVHSDEEIKGESNYVFEEKENQGIRELRVYFKKADSPIGLINRLINFIRYRKAQFLGYKRLYPDSKPDLCHVHVLARSSFLALKLKKEENIPFVITEHWSGYLPENGALKASGKATYYRRVANQAAAINTVSQHLANAMKAHGIVNKFTVIPNVVDTSIFCNESGSKVKDDRTRTPDSNLIKKLEADPSTQLRNQSQRLEDNVNILFVGNILQRPKRILDIIQVFGKIAKVRQDFKLHIYGEGRDEGRMLLMIRDLGLQEFIEYHGSTDRKGVAQAMQQADFLFLYSEFENQPCVINEALCCGCPVVVPDIEGIVEFMQDDFGLLFPRLKAEKFEEAILKMMDSHKNYDSSRISEMAAEKFGESSLANQFSVFYQNAIENS